METTISNPSLLLSARDTAKALSISPRKLWELSQLPQAKGGIPHVRIGRLVRYRPESLREWLAQRESSRG